MVRCQETERHSFYKETTFWVVKTLRKQVYINMWEAKIIFYTINQSRVKEIRNRGQGRLLKLHLSRDVRCWKHAASNVSHMTTCRKRILVRRNSKFDTFQEEDKCHVIIKAKIEGCKFRVVGGHQVMESLISSCVLFQWRKKVCWRFLSRDVTHPNWTFHNDYGFLCIE